MKIDEISSQRLKIISFPLIVGVVFIHAYSTDVGMLNTSIGLSQSGSFSQFVRDFISQGVARISVPLFFMISGYFFFIGFEWSTDKYTRKLRQRIDSLLVPFLIWNCLTLSLVAIGQLLPSTQIYFSGKTEPISSYGLYDYLNALLGIDRRPISYQFWFIRDLMVMILLVPLLQLILRKIPVLFLSVISLLWFFNLWPVYIPSAAAFLFFYIGSFFAFSGKSFFVVDEYGKTFITIYIAILLIDVLTKGNDLNIYIHRVGVLFGIASAIYVTKLVLEVKKLRLFLLWASSSSFFVFAIHEPVLTILKKVAYRVVDPNSDMVVLALYFLIPFLVIGISILFFLILKAVAPKLLSVLSGGR